MVLFLCSMLAAGSIFAAGQQEKDVQKETEKRGDGQVTITMSWWGDGKRNDVYNAVIDAFEKENPNIKVERTSANFSGYFDKLATQFAGGAAPDLLGMHQRYASDYASKGSFADLQPFVDAGILDLSDIPSSIVESGKINGTLVFIPQGLSGMAVSYYTKTFDELGVEYPPLSWTWDDFEAKLVEIKKAADAKGMKDFWPCSDFSNDINNFNYWARSKGEHAFSSDGKLGFSKDTLRSWLEFWKSLRDRGLVPDAETTVEYAGGSYEQSLYANNNIAMSILPISQLWLYQNLVSEGEYRLVRFPKIKGGKNPELFSGASYTINAHSLHQKEAAMLMNFFLNNPEGQRIFKQEQGLPPAKKALSIVKKGSNPAQLRSIEFVENSLVPNASPEPYPPAGFNEVNSNFTNCANAVSLGEKGIDQSVDDFFVAAQNILHK